MIQISQHGGVAEQFKAIKVALPLEELFPIVGITLTKREHPQNHLILDDILPLDPDGAEPRRGTREDIECDLALERVGRDEDIPEHLSPRVAAILKAPDQRVGRCLKGGNLEPIPYANRQAPGDLGQDVGFQFPEPIHIERGKSDWIPLPDMEGDLHRRRCRAHQRRVELDLTKSLTPVEGVDPPVIAPEDPGIEVGPVDANSDPRGHRGITH
jgi:hypothetical protein